MTVLAAYEPVALLDLGLVLSMDLAEVRARFIGPALAVGALGLVVIALGTTLFFRVSGPMLDEVRASERRFRDLFDNMNSGVAVLQPVDVAPSSASPTSIEPRSKSTISLARRSSADCSARRSPVSRLAAC